MKDAVKRTLGSQMFLQPRRRYALESSSAPSGTVLVLGARGKEPPLDGPVTRGQVLQLAGLNRSTLYLLAIRRVVGVTRNPQRPFKQHLNCWQRYRCRHYAQVVTVVQR